METEFQNATGKGIGEVMRDIADFLSYPCILSAETPIDLRTVLPDLNMYEQFSFALLSEAYAQGWSQEATESFYLRTCSPFLDKKASEDLCEAFRNQDGALYRSYQQKYDYHFTMKDHAYWPTCLGLGIHLGQIKEVMAYLRLFIVCLMEFAYMDDRNPKETNAWNYYEAFRSILDDLLEEPDTKKPQNPQIRALGGTAGKRNGDVYSLSLGIDIQNPNPNRMACDVSLDITLKDRSGNLITVIRDKLECIDPGAIYHYGVTRRIKGAAVGSITATAKAGHFLKLTIPIMNHITLSQLRLSRKEDVLMLSGKMNGSYDRPLRSLTLHYQLLDDQNKILGGGSEWLYDGLTENATRTFSTKMTFPIPRAAKAVYSIDFNAKELIDG